MKKMKSMKEIKEIEMWGRVQLPPAIYAKLRFCPTLKPDTIDMRGFLNTLNFIQAGVAQG